MSIKTLKHIMNFSAESDGLKLDRVCRMVREMGLGISVTQHSEDYNSVTLWAYGRITKALHQEIKARAIGVSFAVDLQGMPAVYPETHRTETPMMKYGGDGAFVTLASEEISQ